MSEHSSGGSEDSGLVIEHRGRVSDDSRVVSEDSSGVIEHSDQMSEQLNKVSDRRNAVRELFASVDLDSATMCRHFETIWEDIVRRATV